MLLLFVSSLTGAAADGSTGGAFPNVADSRDLKVNFFLGSCFASSSFISVANFSISYKVDYGFTLSNIRMI
jgi:hypothetical protein